MAKSNRISEENLIKTIEDYSERINSLGKKYSINITEKINNFSFTKLLAFKDSEHWDFFEEQIRVYLENKQFAEALQEINNALCYLQGKAELILSDGTPAFSNMAALSNYSAKIPGLGFFSDSYRNYRQAGMNKTKERLDEIDSWLKELKENLGPTFLEKLEDGVKNLFSRS